MGTVYIQVHQTYMEVQFINEIVVGIFANISIPDAYGLSSFGRRKNGKVPTFLDEGDQRFHIAQRVADDNQSAKCLFCEIVFLFSRPSVQQMKKCPRGVIVNCSFTNFIGNLFVGNTALVMKKTATTHKVNYQFRQKVQLLNIRIFVGGTKARKHITNCLSNNRLDVSVV